MGYKYELTWLLRLPTPDMPCEDSNFDQNGLLCWKRSNGNIILGFFREGARLYPVGLNVLIISSMGETLGYAKIIKSEIHLLPDGTATSVVEFNLGRRFEGEEKKIMSQVIMEMYGMKPV